MSKEYICISIKHSMHGNGWYLWCPNCQGYTGDIEKAGLYKEEDFKGAGDFPIVKMTADICEKYKKYDSVLVDKEDFIVYSWNLRNFDTTKDLDNMKAALHGIKCILTSDNIDYRTRIEKALARIEWIRRSN